jgi:hypothetical protein
VTLSSIPQRAETALANDISRLDMICSYQQDEGTAAGILSYLRMLDKVDADADVILVRDACDPAAEAD